MEASLPIILVAMCGVADAGTPNLILGCDPIVGCLVLSRGAKPDEHDELVSRRVFPRFISFSKEERVGAVRVAGFYLNEAQLRAVFVRRKDIVVREVLREECIRDAPLGQLRSHVELSCMPTELFDPLWRRHRLVPSFR